MFLDAIYLLPTDIMGSTAKEVFDLFMVLYEFIQMRGFINFNFDGASYNDENEVFSTQVLNDVGVQRLFGYIKKKDNESPERFGKHKYCTGDGQHSSFTSRNIRLCNTRDA